MSARGVQALLVSLRVMLPVFSFVNVGEAKFPILVRLINTFEESLSLFVLRQVKEDFDDPRCRFDGDVLPSPRWNDTGPSKCSSRRATP